MSSEILWMSVLIASVYGAVVTNDINHKGGEVMDFQEENVTYYWNHHAKKDTSCKCGIPNLSRIVGGTEVNPKRKYPWQVSLQHRGWIKCGGSIINDRWILTAAHCIANKKTCQLNPTSWLSQVRIMVGMHYRVEWLHSNEDKSYIKKYEVKTWIIHPDYYKCKWTNYDFALLELTEAIPFNHIIRPVCLPKDDSKSYAGQTGIASGWGRTSEKEPGSILLKEVEIPILANDKCGKWGTRSFIKMCAGGEKGVCNGDSGGPLSVVENGKHVQVGVASYVHSIAGCGSASYPGIFARTSKVISWIATTAANGMKCE